MGTSCQLLMPLVTLLIFGRWCHFADGTKHPDSASTPVAVSAATEDVTTAGYRDLPNVTAQSSGVTTTINTAPAQDGTTIPPGRCLPPNVPSDLNMTSPQQAFYDVNSTLTWQCLEHDLCYVVEGDDAMMCQENGQWSSSVPTCRYSNIYQCSNPLLTASVTNADHFILGPNATLSGDQAPCGLTLVLQCRPGHKIRSGATRLTTTCHNEQGWTKALYSFQCIAEMHFIKCLKLLPLQESNPATTTVLIPNGEFECRNHCLNTTHLFSILLGSDKCMCTSNGTLVHETEIPDTCNQPCAGQEDQYCGGRGREREEDIGAAYFTIGGCYRGLQALSANNVTLTDLKMTPESCRQFCIAENADHAVLSGTKCTCLQSHHLHVLSRQTLVPENPACSLPCLEDHSQMCGGLNAVFVYNLDPNVRYGSAKTCHDLYMMGIRTHGYYELEDGVHYCYMADNTTCSEGWLGYMGSCYLFVTQPTMLQQAIARCSDEGGHLLSVHTWKELNFIVDTLQTFTVYNLTDHWVLGLYNPGGHSHYTWGDGLAMRAVTFALKRPFAVGGGDCVQTRQNLALEVHWEDVPCSGLERAFVCEKLAESQLTEAGTCARSEVIIGTRSFSATPMTVGLCRQVCQGMHPGTFAIVNAQRCACVTEAELRLGGVVSKPGQCHQPCPGQLFQMCGSSGDPLIFNIYPPLQVKDLAKSCDDLYFNGIHYPALYMLRVVKEPPETDSFRLQFCNFTLNEVMCPPTWLYANGSCLRPFLGAAQDVHQAMEICDTRGGGFLTTRLPPDSEITRVIADVAAFTNNFQSISYLMGLVAPLNSTVLRMLDGSLVPEFHQLEEGQPQSVQDQCVKVKSLDGNSSAVQCSTDLRFICQKDVALSGSVIEATGNSPHINRQVISKLTCVTPAPKIPPGDEIQLLTFSWEDMTLTSCLERCRGVRAQWAVVTFDICHCYDDNSVAWEALAGMEDKVQCGELCPGHPFQYCGGGGYAAVMIVGMYPTVARNCSQLYMEGVRMEATYLIQPDPGSPPVQINCTFFDGKKDSSAPSGWIDYKDQLYSFQPITVTAPDLLQDARAACWAEGGYLLSVVDKMEDHFLNFTIGGLASLRYKEWLTGYTDAGQNGVAGWMAPDLFLYTPGDEFHCNGHRNCCVRMETVDGQLRLIYAPCSKPDGFICKKPSARQGCFAISPSTILTPLLANEQDMSTLLCRQGCRGLNPSVGGYMVARQSCYCLGAFEGFYNQLKHQRVNYTRCQNPCEGHSDLFCGDEDTALVFEDTIVYDSEKAPTCREINHNGLYINMNYRLRGYGKADHFQNCYQKCGNLTVASPASLSSAAQAYRSNVTISCPPGWVFPSGALNAFAYCGAEGWNVTEQNLTCSIVTCPELSVTHATADVADRQHNTTVTLTCNDGFETVGALQQYTVVCMGDGHWLPAPTDCHKKTCSFPSNLTRLRDPPPYDVIFEFRTTLTLLCQEGWTTEGGSSVQFVTCNSSSLWEPELLSCSKQTVCRGQEFLNLNTTWVHQPGFNTTTTTTTTTTAAPHPPLTLITTTPTTTTTSTTTTSLPYVTTEGLQASTPPTPPAAGVFVGQHLLLQCYSQHQFQDGSVSMTVTCTADGVFQPPLQNCTAPCNASAFTYSHVLMERVGDSLTADVTCYPGYQFPGGGGKGQTACSGGSWVNVTQYMCQLPACVEVNVTNAQVNVTAVGSAALATLRCHEGHTFMNGVAEKHHVCVNGSWEPPVTDCTAHCPDFTVGGATVTRYHDNQNQERATVRCQAGYHFPADDTIEKTLTCSLSGTWSIPSVEDCVLTTCNDSRLTALSHTSVSTIQTVGDALLKQVTCTSGYQFPDQTHSRVYGCDGGGVWYPSLDNCSEIECSTMQGHTNAAILSDIRIYQSEVRLVCAVGWRFADGNSSKRHVCQANRTWSPLPEYCFPSENGGAATEPLLKKKDSPVYSTTTVNDSRPSAIAVGTGAVVVFVVLLAGILFLDAATLWRHLAVMKENISGFCGKKTLETNADPKPDSATLKSSSETTKIPDGSADIAEP